MPESPTSTEEKQRGALLIAASLIAAIRLRGAPIDNSPKTIAVIHDSIRLARKCFSGSRQCDPGVGVLSRRKGCDSEEARVLTLRIFSCIYLSLLIILYG